MHNMQLIIKFSEVFQIFLKIPKISLKCFIQNVFLSKLIHNNWMIGIEKGLSQLRPFSKPHAYSIERNRLSKFWNAIYRILWETAYFSYNI